MLEVKLFPQYRHLTSDGHSTVAYDVKSCSLLEVDDLTARLLEEAGVRHLSAMDEQLIAILCRQGFSGELCREAQANVRQLLEQGLLTEQDEWDACQSESEFDLGSIVLSLAQTCQLRCRYCFAEGGNFGDETLPPLMDWSIAKAAIDLLLDTPGRRTVKSLSFFGGEPLLNWPVIVESVNYADAKAQAAGLRMSYSITTNGLALDQERATFMRDHHFGVMLSVDGDESLHNQLRPHCHSEVNSWQGTKAALDLLHSLGMKVTGRATITAINPDAVAVAGALRAMGFDAINLQPVECELDSPMHLGHQELVEYTQSSIRWAELAKLDLSNAQRIFAKIMQGQQESFFCGVGKSSVAVDSSGRFFTCHRVIGNGKYHLGDVYSGLDWSRLHGITGQLKVHTMLGCKSCWARYICNGMCPMDNENFTGSPTVPNPMNCYYNQKMIDFVFEQYLKHAFSRLQAKAE